MSDSLWPHRLQHVRPPCPPPIPGVYPNSCPLIWWCHPNISSSVVPFSSHLQSFPASGSFPKSQFFTSGGQRVRASASASVLPMKIQGWFPLRLLVWSPCCSRDSQESFPAPQFNSTTSLVLSLLDGPTLTSICDYWKNHSFAYMEVCQQSGLCFLICCLVCHSFPLKVQASSNVMATVTLCSDSGAQENNMSLLPLFPLLIAMRAFPGDQMVKNPPAMQETWIWALDWEDPLEEETTTYSSILAWEIPWREEPGGIQSMRAVKE